MMLFFLVACGDEPQKTAERSVNIAEYTGLTDDASWIYRDSGWNMEDPDYLDENSLLRAEHVGEGRVEFRRGLRWADGTPYGFLQFDMTDGFALTEWNIQGTSGDGWYPFSGSSIDVNTPSSGDWSCTATEPVDPVATYYASFEQAYVFDCTGGGLEGQWVFAYDFGLVHYMSLDGMGLDLVAPW